MELCCYQISNDRAGDHTLKIEIEGGQKIDGHILQQISEAGKGAPDVQQSNQHFA